MRTSTTLTVILVSLCAARASAQAEFKRLGNLPGGDGYGFASGISADGSAICGAADHGAAYLLAYRWTAATGMVALGDLPGAEEHGDAYGISPDGGVCVGGSRTQDDSYWQWHAFLHDGIYLSDLGTLPSVSDGWSYANDVSNGGEVATGDTVASDGSTRAFHWSTTDGMSELALPTGYTTSIANAVSADGKSIVGRMGGWGYPTQAFLWTEANGILPLGGRNAHDLSPDGTMVLGISANANAAYWTAADGWVELGWGAWGDDMGVHAASSDHQVIVGYDGYHGQYWTPEGGRRWIEDVLAQEYGVDLQGWVPFLISGMSDDGTVISGSAYEAANTNEWQPFRAVVPRTTFVRMGYGLAGTGGGIPNLYGRGDMAAGGHGFLAVENARGGMPVFFIVGASAIYAPLFKGTLVPSFDLIVGTTTDWLGSVTIGGPLPDDLPVGIDFYAQAWIVDPLGPKGFAATNAIQGTTN